MAKKDRKKKDEHVEEPLDLAARIGARPPSPPAPAPPADPAPPPRIDAPRPPRRPEGALIIGLAEPPPPVAEEGDEPRGAAIPSPRLPPGIGETDLVVTPLPTPDDWHRFELALRRVRGVGVLRPEYYRHGVLKVRVGYAGPGRLASALRAGVPGYRVRVIGEDRSTLQILVTPEDEERRPG